MDKSKIEAARAALQHMDDFAMMSCAVDPVGPRGVLEQFIAEVERLAGTDAVYLEMVPVASGDLLASLQRAIDEAEHKPGQWARSISEMGGVCTPGDTLISNWGNFSFKRDAWLAIAAVNALPELMERVRSAEKSERAADQEVERLRAELERLRMQLAACGVVAMANTPESAVKARDMHPEYRSASCDDVARVVDSEMELRAKMASISHHAWKICAWRYCMSYNDSYFGEPAGTLKSATEELERLLLPPVKACSQPKPASCCGDPGDCAQPCETGRKPSAKTARALEQAREIRELPAGLSWDQAPWWATVLVRHLDGQHAWAAAYANGAKADAADGDGAVTRLGAISEYWSLIAHRPTQKAPCTDCGACIGGPHGCGKPGLHGKAEPADDGWIEWNGGECPVDEGTLVDVRHFDGEVFYGANAFAFGPAYDWSHETPHKNGDIVAYRLHRPTTPRRDATQS